MSLIRKWKDMPASVKSSIAFALSTFFLKGISFITTPIFTRIMDPSQYGLIATYNSWLSILEVFALLGLTSAGVFNVGLNDYKNERDEYISTILSLCNISTLFLFTIFGIIKLFVLPNFLLDNNLLILMFIHFIFSPAQIFWVTRQRYEYKYKLATLTTIGSILLSQILAIIAVMTVSQNHGTAKLWANEIGILLFCIPIYIFIFRKGKTFFNKTIWKNVLIFALPLIPHYLAQHVMSGADRIMISNIVSTSDAGIYNVVANISMIAVIFWNAINASLIPYTYEKINLKEYNSLNNIINILLLGYGFMCLIVIIIAPEVLKILAPKEYYGGIYAIPPIATVAFLNALYNIYANIEFYYKKSARIAIATIVSAVLNIGLNLILIPKLSYVGAAYTTLISNIALIFMHYIGYKKCTNTHIYNDRFILVFSFVLIVVCIGSTLLYFNDFIRYLVLAFIMIYLYRNRVKFIKIIKQIKK